MTGAGNVKIEGAVKSQPPARPAEQTPARRSSHQAKMCKAPHADNYLKGTALDTLRSYVTRTQPTVTSVRHSAKGDITVTASDGSAARNVWVDKGKNICQIEQVKPAGGSWKTIDDPCAPSQHVRADHELICETNPLIRKGEALTESVKKTIIDAVNAKRFASIENGLICFANATVYRVNVKAIGKNKLMMHVSYTPKGGRRLTVDIPLNHVVRTQMHGGGVLPSYRPLVACLSNSQRAIFVGTRGK